ncbi:DNA replication licensing factor MCM5 [Selaginella moellendorffii]|uniref:DNA replication licensing factor MCM5 n=1 Tax=Selaginella moellendorffii TaxID=88036 RepID=UPI000D1CE4F6|nr:DNA replication licensing factor MCM5 isoform X1 [Selaginella moellendorffii]XP_024542552.1 DNA replication licensing factor MCM5 [Selaginella moellendorffii]|eukprot:XP_024528637.1 DNA replication licensing factor MCM5 isoform X1 [Selaginella moellendorffii]
MSGWDEGAVFYSDQAQYPEQDGSPEVTRHSAQRKFKEFFRSYSHPDGSFTYRESLLHNPKSVEVSIEDLHFFDGDLAEKVRNFPTDYLPLLESAAAEVVASLQSKVAAETGEMAEPDTGEVQVLLASKELVSSIRTLGAGWISKLVKVSGIIIAASRTKAKATAVTLCCRNCKNVKVVPCRPGLGGAMMPRSCDHVPQPGEEPCPIDPWLVIPDRSKYVDQQTLKLQENPEDVPTGELPRNLLLAADRNLVQKTAPGTRVTVLGVYSIFQTGNATTQKGAVAIRQPYLRVVGMDHAAEGNSRGAPSFTADEENEFKEFSRKPDSYQLVCNLLAPSIFGHDDIKKAVACLMFGGSRKSLPDGVRLRGDINVLLLGDPSTAKSQFLKFVEKTAPIAVYTSGKGSSAAGLTASVIRDASSREFYLEGGAMVLADGGVVCIDEFDKMRPEDRVAIHEAMEQQTISIAKAGITTVLNSRTSVLAAANPPSGRYDDLKTAQENIDLQTTILSRFDLIFIVKDARDHQRDMQIARHVVTVHASAGFGSKDADVREKYNWLKRYIEFCRDRCRPRLSDSAAVMLQNSYVEIRKQMREQSQTGESTPIPITVRQLEAIVRISEAIAKMQLSQEATEEHVTEAIRLFYVSTMDAARSGITDNITVTPEMRNEIQQVETQIKRRMGIGSFMSERRLIDELMRMGMPEPTVRRALVIMHQRDEIEYKRERRVIVRKA